MDSNMDADIPGNPWHPLNSTFRDTYIKQKPTKKKPKSE